MKRVVVLALVFTCSALVESAPSRRYVVTGATITDLGALGGDQSVALDINDAGTIVGWAATAQGYKHAFRFSSGVMDDIGSSLSTYPSEGTGINNQGVVVGNYHDGVKSHGLLWSGQLVGLEAGFARTCVHGSEATAISDNWHIAGRRVFCGLPLFYAEATLWRSFNSFIALEPTFPWPSITHDVNANGIVVGRSKNREQMMRWRWLGAQAVQADVVPPPPSTVASYAGDGDAMGINDAGSVVGNVSRWDGTQLSYRAFFWDGYNTASQDLGVLPTGNNSYADDVNEDRFVAGYADVNIQRPPAFNLTRERGFLYHQDFGLYALPTLASYLSSCRAYALNERNAQSGLIQVVGYCESSTGLRAVRWDVTVALRSITVPRQP